MSARTAFRLAWERRLEKDAPDDVVMDVLELAMGNLAGDELDIIGHLIERAKSGRSGYGQFHAGLDTRSLVKEGLDEIIDGLFYLAGEVLKLQRRAEVPQLRLVGDFELEPVE